jgi:hypothetical protein
MELSKILIGIVLVSVVSTTFLLFISEGVTQYSPVSVPTTYANSFNNISVGTSSLNNIVNDTETGLKIDGNSNAVSDFIGFFFGNGYKAGKTFIEGMKLTNIIVNEGIENTVGSTGIGQSWKNAIGTIIIIALISILLHFIIKSERL